MTEQTFVRVVLLLGLGAWIAWGFVFVTLWALHGHGVDFGMSLVSALAVAKIGKALKEDTCGK